MRQEQLRVIVAGDIDVEEEVEEREEFVVNEEKDDDDDVERDVGSVGTVVGAGGEGALQDTRA